jgi:hypothetical protein
MKIAIHQRSNSFSDLWVKYCREKNISFKIVNCYGSDIIEQLNDCHGLMWHWDLNDYKSALFARQLIISIEKMGIKVFPDTNTCWHYDDKVGQKYLFEAIDAPNVESYVFYSKQDALKWTDNALFPIVFKLRNGASSSNVRLIKNKQKAKKLVNRAFGRGFDRISPIGQLKERFYILNRDKDFNAVKKVIGGFARLFIQKEVNKFSHKEKGYIYFQDFIADNDHDTRLVVIGERCFGMTRYCRKGDFRASGSGIKDYNHELVNTDCVNIAFTVSEKLNTQSIALDFIKDSDGFKIIEISYAFVSERFPGYWDRSLFWHDGEVCPQEFMVEDFVKSINSYVL